MKTRKYPELWLSNWLDELFIVYPDDTYECINVLGDHYERGEFLFNREVGDIYICDIKDYPAEKAKKKWVPKLRGAYYFISMKGMVCRTVWYGWAEDHSILEFYNVFKTKKQANEARDKIKELSRELS